MSKSITVELQFFAISILWGAIVLLAYDQLRILRRIIRHNNFWITVQDLFFWIIASVFIFAMIYAKNSGTIRGFSVMGMVLGMVVYHYALSDFIVMFISRGILFLLRPIFFILRELNYGLKLLIRMGRKLANRIFMQLKNLLISVKIKLIKKKNNKSKEKTGKKRKRHGIKQKKAKKKTKIKIKEKKVS